MSDTTYLTLPETSEGALPTLQQACPEYYPFLLETAAVPATGAGVDILFACPREMLVLETDGQLNGPFAEQAQGDFLRALDLWWLNERICHKPAHDGNFRGGWFIYLGYELVGSIEPVLRLPPAKRLPIAFATRIPAALVRDRRTGVTKLVAESGYPACKERIQADWTSGLVPMEPGPGSIAAAIMEEDPTRYLEMVCKTRRYIHDGDVFQANLSRGWQASLAGGITPMMVYQRLKKANPAPFAGLALHGETAIISSSPERLVRVQGEWVETRPIAGTRPRGSSLADDMALIDELISHPKERAEHVMLLDLERNDLGRIALPGSVQVDELMVVETYRHVHHIVSNICARRRPDTTPGQVLRAAFPGGTITGCPKVRCMEIIAELEQQAREAYTGAMGYLNRDGDMDFNILIRTLVQQGRELNWRAGAGIVADSVPEMELEETRAKALGLARALGCSL